MKLLLITISAAALFASDSPVSKPRPRPAKVFDRQLTSTEKEVVSLVEAMPADKFSFAPTNGEFKGVRTFAQEAKHIAFVIDSVSSRHAGPAKPHHLRQGRERPR